MATTSFAVGSVSVAIVWGTFFYPPPAQRPSAPAAASVPAVPVAPASPVVAPPVVAAAAITQLDAGPAIRMLNAAQLAAKQ